ncbi:metal-dependent hydrolase [Streptomyces sp. AC495_CC817]|uniref:metal-dependent hydrolase n=1 Tax=Streptomyces sp. AC495_CC817 TaxID=2823900 RepID=UPI001C2628B8|nr:metal-dependent hydrolase [Streptomyces sp. AC495_CC817]
MADSASASTIVTFADGATAGDGIVVRVASSPEGAILVVDATPFHPVDHTWPDQPGDSGVVSFQSTEAVVVDAVMAAVNDGGELAIGADIPVKRGAEGWTWLVAHRLAGDVPADLVPGATVHLSVDADRRAGLSRGHTACHLASLALDLAVADLWRKDPGTDALGNPDFEGRANQSSRIHQDGAVDEYRLGKSLRKAGFDTEAFGATLGDREAAINAQLAAWVASGAPSSILTDGPTITDRRTWRCSLPEGTAEILCGGTHAASLAEFSSITVMLDLSDPQLLVMTTTAVPA